MAAPGRRLSGEPTVAGVAGGDSAHVWTRFVLAWHLAFWTFLAIALIALSVQARLSPGRRALGIAVVGGLALAYAGLRPWSNRRWPQLGYLGVAIVGAGVACGVDPTLSVLLFILYPQIWLFSPAVRVGVVSSAALTVSGLLGFLTADGWSVDSLIRLGPTMAVSLAFSLMMGIWVNRIIDQSRDRAQLIHELQKTRTELGEVHHAQGVTAERERIAREVHDTLAQGFTSIVMLTQTARVRAEAAGAGAADLERLTLIESVARENLGEARALVAAFSPVALQGSTLADALLRLAARFRSETGIAIEVDVEDGTGELAGLSRDQEVVILRAAQEALVNVRRHAGARRVTFRMTVGVEDARVEVVDDGRGFDPTTGPGFGLTGMRDRVRAAGGELDLTSRPGDGTRVRVRMPLTGGRSS